MTDYVRDSLYGGLRLQKDHSDEVLEHVDTTQRIRSLCCFGNENITVAGVENIAGIEKLNRVVFSQTNADDDWMKPVSQMDEIRYINAISTRISSKGLRELVDMPELESVDLNCTKVSKKDAERFNAMRNERGLGTVFITTT